MDDVVPVFPCRLRQADRFRHQPQVVFAESVAGKLANDLLNPQKRQARGDDLSDLAVFAYQRPRDPVEDVFEHRKVLREPPHRLVMGHLFGDRIRFFHESRCSH
jgi:hypothetical protein